jgi:hypothetical protein
VQRLGTSTLNRHEFLTALHAVLKPKIYLEVGVQHGTSLKLAHAAETAIGIDPHPLCGPAGNQVIFKMTSDEYFQQADLLAPIDLAFIDGMHLFEYALRDFANVERYCHHFSSVIILDDVLPYNQAIAAREQPPGDWTGDVWKVYFLLRMYRPDLTLQLVDTSPTGTLVVTDLNPGVYVNWHKDLVWGSGDIVPTEIIERERVFHPSVVINDIYERLNP